MLEELKDKTNLRLMQAGAALERFQTKTWWMYPLTAGVGGLGILVALVTYRTLAAPSRRDDSTD